MTKQHEETPEEIAARESAERAKQLQMGQKPKSKKEKDDG